jgi:RNA polymerase sigma-70 factor (ECF subfamily)
MIYNTIIAPHRNYMYNFARKLCRNSVEAEDITQQALIKAYVYSQNNHIDPKKIKSFLSTTVRNTFIDSVRGKKHCEFYCSETPDGYKESFLESIEDTFSYETIINSAETNYYILPVLEKLKKHKTLYQVLDYFIQEYSYEEIAKLMGIPMGSVKSRLYQARKFVKENISEEFLANI